MRVYVRDNVKNSHRARTYYLTQQVTDLLNRFSASIRQIDLTITLEGHDADAVTHCHVTANLGSLGVVVADWRDMNEHRAFKGAVSKLVHGVTRRIGKRKSRRLQTPAVAEVLAAAG